MNRAAPGADCHVDTTPARLGPGGGRTCRCGPAERSVKRAAYRQFQRQFQSPARAWTPALPVAWVWRVLLYWPVLAVSVWCAGLLAIAPASAAGVDLDLREATRLRQQGDLTRAGAVLEQALARIEAEAPPNGQALARIQAEWGAVLLQARRLDAAQQALTAAFGALSGTPRAWVALDLATLALLRAQPEAAQTYLAEAETLAPVNALVQRTVRLGRVRLAPSIKRLAALRAVLDVPAHTSASYPASVAELSWRLPLAHLALDWAESAGAESAAAVALAAQALPEQSPDRASTPETTYPRWHAEWVDAHSRLALARGDTMAALALLRTVSANAGPQLTLVPDALLLRLLPRRARLARQAGQPAEELMAWRQAAQAAERLRPDLPIEDEYGRSTYRQVLEPVYLGLIEALLAREAVLDRNAAGASERLRVELVSTLEQLRQAEMQDYLGDRCEVDAVKGDSPTQLPAGSAVLHVLVLEQRVELLLQSGNAPVRRVSVDVPALQIGLTARALAARLRNGDAEHLPLAQQLYDWLLRPLEPWLASASADTLVVVPHGPLRLIPFGALHDGQGHAIEKWAFATTTGLSMTNTSASQRSRAVLLAGLSEPGAVVDQLDARTVGRLLAAAPAQIAGARGDGAPGSVASGAASGAAGGAAGGVVSGSDRSAGLATRYLVRGMGAANGVVSPAVDAAGAARGTAAAAAPEAQRSSRLRAVLALPGVAQEVQALRPLAAGRTLLNPAFTVAAFERAAGAGEHAVLHLATHGVFGGSAASSYVMAHDGLITLEGLQSLLRSPALRRDPVELLSLSACETAEGDERSPLGLSGAALRARAKAVLGALWPVADAAAVPLMQGFYAAHLSRGLGKAHALQQAQLALLRQPETAHPFFWAPFLLIGNWL